MEKRNGTKVLDVRELSSVAVGLALIRRPYSDGSLETEVIDSGIAFLNNLKKSAYMGMVFLDDAGRYEFESYKDMVQALKPAGS